MENEDNPKMDIDAEQIKKVEEAAREKGISRDEAIADNLKDHLFKKE